MKRLLLGFGLIGLVLAACSSGLDAQPVVASTQGTVGVGTQRVLIGIHDAETGEPISSEEIEVTATLRDRIGSPLGEFEGEFVWMIPDVRGLYAFYMDLPGPGTFQVTLQSEAFGEAGPVGLVAVDDPPMVSAGEAAPLSETRTIDDHALEDITTDDDPDPAFYEMTVAEAVQSGPAVIVFATPVWCTTQACGPMLDQVKALSADFPDLNFVHVEVYENVNAASFDDLVLVPSVGEWGLPTEPWVFVTDSNGVVTAAFEGAASTDELAAAFESVSP